MKQPDTTAPVVLVTGASAGIGQAIAHRFAAAGFRIVAVARGRERLEALSQALSPMTDVAVLATDVAVPEAGQQAVDLAMQRFGRLDCLVNNAASGKWAPIHATSDAMLDEIVDISFKAPVRFARAALAVLQSGSSVINVGSTFGLVGGLHGGVYCAVKAGLVGLTQSLAVEYGARGIRSNLVAPGVIRTDMTDAQWGSPVFQRLNQEMTPSVRDGTPEDVANAVFFLASDEGGYINGQTIALDGGWSTTKYLAPDALTCVRVPNAGKQP